MANYLGKRLLSGLFVPPMLSLLKTCFIPACAGTLEEAALVRKEAELALHEPAILHYEQWVQKAAEDAEWAKENPIEIHVERSVFGEFQVVLLYI